MYTSRISGLGHFVPDNIVTNDDLSKLMDTNDEWIQERTGIKERRWIEKGSSETSASMGAKAAKIAIEKAGIDKNEIDFIIFATLSPDMYFPGCGVQIQDMLGLPTVGALDVRNQCSGFVYALIGCRSVYKNRNVSKYFGHRFRISLRRFGCDHSWKGSFRNLWRRCWSGDTN